jgi:excisionase family DNA binding protein
VAEVAERLQLSELTVRRKIAAGEIPAMRLATRGRGPVRVSEHALEHWLHSVPSPADPPEAA